MMNLLRYFKHHIPTPEEAGIDRKESEADNKWIEKIQRNSKKEMIFEAQMINPT